MNNQEKIKGLKEEEYQMLFGVKKRTFDKMLEILTEQYRKEHRQGGRPPKLSVLDKLLIMLCYYREYRTMQHIAFDYNVAKSTVCESIQWVEKTLIESRIFRLPSKKTLYEDKTLEIILIDATEVEIERPKKNRENTIQEKRKNIH